MWRNVGESGGNVAFATMSDKCATACRKRSRDSRTFHTG